MSYTEFSHSISKAQQVNLYQFIRGDNEKVYRFCDADQDIVLNGERYVRAAISDSGRQDGENVMLTIAHTNPIAKLYRGLPPSQTIKVIIMRLHIGDTSNEARVVWIGTIIEAKRPNIATTQLVSASLSNTMECAGLRLTWGRNCPYTLYDYDCKVNPKNFVIAGLTIKALTGTTITVDFPQDLPQGWFNAGFIEWFDDGVREVRAVTVHQNNQLTLMGGTQNLSVGTSIKVYPGCDGQASTCLKKFNNMLNFGGIPHMPNKSPYDGSRVF